MRRIDRDRGRIRARIGAIYKFSPEWSVGTRLRTGNHQSQQSPHLTFTANDGPSDDLEASLDRYFVQYQKDSVTLWAGRNASPFWQQNEMFWDEDVTPTGLAAVLDSRNAGGKLTSTVGAFALPDGATHLNGRLLAGQFKYSASVNKNQFTLAAGLNAFNGKEGARFLRNRNGARDYLIGVISAQWSVPVAGLPLTLGGDVIQNFENYSAADVAPLSVTQRDQKSGYVLSLQYGQLKQSKNWQIGYFYAHIETLAVNAAYAEDDWVRFGNGPQTDGSDIAGHEFRAAYVLTKNLNLVARLFVVEAITSVQDGKRFRIDLNWKL